MKYFVSSGGHNIELEANSPMDAMCEAFERIMRAGGGFGMIAVCSSVGFDSNAGDDLLCLSTVVLEQLGFVEKDGVMTRCPECRGVGRVDCCDKIDCSKCGGLFTRDCPRCSEVKATA